MSEALKMNGVKLVSILILIFGVIILSASVSAALNEFVANTEIMDDQRNPSVAVHADGSFVAVWIAPY